MKYIYINVFLLMCLAFGAFTQTVDTLTIGQYNNCDFKTISLALENLYEKGINNPTMLLVTSNYNPSDSLFPEKFPINFKHIEGTSQINTVSVFVESEKDINFIDSLEYIMYFKDAQYFNIYGNNKLNIINTNTDIRSSHVISSIYLDENVQNIVIDGCNIMAGGNDNQNIFCIVTNTYTYNVNSKFLKYSSCFSNKLKNIQISNEIRNITLTNNRFSRAFGGVFLVCFSDKESNINVSNNMVGDARDEYLIANTGIYVYTDADVLVHDNKVFNIKSDSTYYSLNGIAVVANKVKVYNNLVVDVVNNAKKQTLDDVIFAVGISIQNVDSALCYNNMISHIAGDNVYGLVCYPKKNAISEVYYNSVYLCPDYSKDYFGENVNSCFCFFCGERERLLLRNNIFQNSFGNIYSKYSHIGTAITINSKDINYIIDSALISDHNYYYTDDLTEGYTCCFVDDTACRFYYEIDKWNEMNNNDTTCKNINPNFVSTSLLKIGKINAAGTPISKVKVDYFGKLRNDTMPDVGAHELQVNTGISDNKAKDIKLKAYYDGNNIILKSDNNLEGEIYVYDLSGRIVAFTNVILACNYLEMPFNDKSGIYIVFCRRTNASVKIIVEKKSIYK